METKKSRQHQYSKLKGATRITTSERSVIDEPSKSSSQEVMDIDSSNLCAPTDQLDASALSGNNFGIERERRHRQQQQPARQHQQQTIAAASLAPQQQCSFATTNSQFIGPTTTTPTTSSSALPATDFATASSSSSSSYNIHQQTRPASVAAPTTTTTTTTNSSSIGQHQHQHQQQQQQQPFRTPQILPCDIKSLFECPICFDYAVPPIYQCQNGHLVCQSCSSKITHCPTCRVPVSEPSIRNLQLDRLANTFQFPCKYNFNGCLWKSYWFKKREHEEECEYISYSCPCPGTTCKWTGLLTQVMPHLSEHHKSITRLSGEDIVFLATDINLKGAVDWVMIQSCFNQNFLLVLEKQEFKTGQQQFFAVVQLIGSQKEAEKFKYKLELSNSYGGKLRRLQWEATPRSILDGVQVAITSYDCLVFDSKLAQHFLSPIASDKQDHEGEGQGENLGINVTIERLV